MGKMVIQSAGHRVAQLPLSRHRRACRAQARRRRSGLAYSAAQVLEIRCFPVLSSVYRKSKKNRGKIFWPIPLQQASTEFGKLEMSWPPGSGHFASAPLSLNPMKKNNQVSAVIMQLGGKWLRSKFLLASRTDAPSSVLRPPSSEMNRRTTKPLRKKIEQTRPSQLHGYG